MGEQNKNFKIKIVGVGDAGVHITENLRSNKAPNIEYMAINTDWVVGWNFQFQQASRFVKIGKKTTKGLGSGGLPKFGKIAAEEDCEEIKDALKDCSFLIIVAGLGGGTGSGASPVVCEVAKELHIPTIAFATSPPDFEGKRRCKIADDCVEQLKKVVDVLAVISLDKIFENPEFRKISILEVYAKVDEMLRLSITNVIKYIYSQEIEEKSMKDILKTLKNDNLCNIIYEKNNLNPIIEYFSNN